MVKIKFIQKSSASSMDLINTPTPRSKYQVPRLDRQRDRTKRFMRKPAAEKTQRSSSKKSFDSSMKQMYIKSPTSITKQKNKQPDFFTVLAESMISKVASTQVKNKDVNQVRYRQRSSQRYDLQGEDNQYKRFQQQFRYEQQERTQKKNYETKLKTLQAEIDLKNHEISILSGQIQRIKLNFEEEKQRRKKLDNERKQISKQMRQLSKINENMKIDVRKYQKQKEHLMKQIEFLQRINFDEKTRSLQSYRQKYLQLELEKAKKQIHKSKSQRQQELQHHIHTLKQEKFTIQSHYKAMKVANQCLIKQLNNTQESIHDIILNSEEYKKLRDKYVRFLEEYKLLRNQYWSLKAESSHKNQANDSSSLFSITASEVEDDLSLLKNESSFSVLEQSKPPKPQKTKSKYEKAKGFPADATYSFNKGN